jgi:hypothetical protein
VLFSRFRPCEREAKKKSVKVRRKKSAKEVKAPSAKEKSANLRFFLPHSRNPVSEPKAARQGESKGLE